MLNLFGFMHRGIRVEFARLREPSRFRTYGLRKRFKLNEDINTWRWYVNGIERMAMSSPNCTNEIRESIARRAVDRAIQNKCQKGIKLTRRSKSNVA
jgi:hypothetical protein